MPFSQDLRYALRMLWKDRGFTAAAVAALALGIGVNTTVFTFVNAVLIRGLPFAEADRILHVDSRRTGSDQDDGIGVSMLDWKDWRRDQRAFRDLGAWSGTAMHLTEPGRLPERFRGTYVSANTFRLLGQRTTIGRDFALDEDRPGAESVVILGFGVWRDRYGADPGVLGRVIRVNEVPTTIVGVMPEGMKFPTNSDLWQPLVPIARDESRDHRRLNAFGRLRAEASPAQAETELTTISGRLAKQYPDTNKDVTVLMMTFNERFNGGRIRLVFLSLMGAVGFVLLIACANVANLLLSRSMQRTREVAMRMALGASRWHIVRQLLLESVLLASLGGLVGLGLSSIGVRLFDRAVANVGKPYWIVFSMDWVVFGYLAAICIVTGIVFGIVPAFQVSRTNVNDVLKEGGRGQAGGVRTRRFTSVMVVCQIALTLVLLTGAGLMIRSFLNLYRLDLGFDTSRILTMRLNLSDKRYPDADARRRFHERLSAELAAVPGAASVTVASHPPLAGAMRRPLDVDGRPADKSVRRPAVSVVLIGDRYFGTLGLSLKRGREFAVKDGTPGAETAIVNERFVGRYFPGERTHRPANQASGRRPRGGTVGHDRRRQPDGAAGERPGHRAGFGRLPPVSTRAGGLCHPHGARTRRANAARDSLAARGAVDRRRPARVRREDVRCHPQGGPLALHRLRHDVRAPRGDCAGDVVGRDLRRHGLFGEPAASGDRHPHGARRRKRHGRLQRAPGWADPARGGSRTRTRGRLRREPAARNARGADAADRPGHVRRHRRNSGRGHGRSVPHPGPPRRARGSTRGIARGLIGDGSLS